MRSTANPGTVFGRPGEDRDVATQRQPLVSDLRRRGERDVVDPVVREGRIAAQELADDLDAHVVRAGLPEVAALARAPERGADAVHVDHLAQGAGHRRDDTSRMATAWEERAARAIERHDDGAARLPEDGDERQRQLTRMGNAAWAAGLCLLMLGRRDEAAAWLVRAAERYRESWPLAPPGSWGRPIGAMKSRLIAGDREGAEADARWALEAGAEESESPIGIYAGVLARLVLGERRRTRCRAPGPRRLSDTGRGFAGRARGA